MQEYFHYPPKVMVVVVQRERDVMKTTRLNKNPILGSIEMQEKWQSLCLDSSITDNRYCN